MDDETTSPELDVAELSSSSVHNRVSANEAVATVEDTAPEKQLRIMEFSRVISPPILNIPAPVSSYSTDVHESMKQEVYKLHRKLQHVHSELQNAKRENEQLYHVLSQQEIEKNNIRILSPVVDRKNNLVHLVAMGSNKAAEKGPETARREGENALENNTRLEEMKAKYVLVEHKLLKMDKELEKRKEEIVELHLSRERYHKRQQQLLHSSEALERSRRLLAEEHRLAHQRLLDTQNAMKLTKLESTQLREYAKKLEVVLEVATRKAKALQQEAKYQQKLKEKQDENQKTLLQEWNYFVLKMENKICLMKQDESKLKETKIDLETILRDQALDLAQKERQIENLIAKTEEAEEEAGSKLAGVENVSKVSKEHCYQLEKKVAEYIKKETSWTFDLKRLEKELEQKEKTRFEMESTIQGLNGDVKALKAEINTLVQEKNFPKRNPTFCIKLKLHSSMVNRIPDYKRKLLGRMRDQFQEAKVEVLRIWLPQESLCNEVVFVLRELDLDMDDVTYSVEENERDRDEDEYIDAVKTKLSNVLETMTADNLQFCVLLPATSAQWWVPTTAGSEKL
jgi:hypothetical protein